MLGFGCLGSQETAMFLKIIARVPVSGEPQVSKQQGEEGGGEWVLWVTAVAREDPHSRCQL